MGDNLRWPYHMKEIWKKVKGYEGSYEVSSLGRVRSLDRVTFIEYRGTGKEWPHILKGKILKPHTHPMGYILVVFSHHGAVKTMKVHRLVAEAFHPNPEMKPMVNHKDAVKNNNRVENLEWATSAENHGHAKSMGLHRGATGEGHRSAKLKEKDVMKIRELAKTDMKKKDIAELFGIDPSSVSQIAVGRTWRHLLTGKKQTP